MLASIAAGVVLTAIAYYLVPLAGRHRCSASAPRS